MQAGVGAGGGLRDLCSAQAVCCGRSACRVAGRPRAEMQGELYLSACAVKLQRRLAFFPAIEK